MNVKQSLNNKEKEKKQNNKMNQKESLNRTKCKTNQLTVKQLLQRQKQKIENETVDKDKGNSSFKEVYHQKTEENPSQKSILIEQNEPFLKTSPVKQSERKTINNLKLPFQRWTKVQ